MRVEVRLELKKPELPRDFRAVFVSAIKGCLMRYDPQIFDEFYKDDDPIMKTFTFGVRMNRPQFRGDTISLGGTQISFTLSTANMRDGMILYNAILHSKSEEFPLCRQNAMRIAQIKLLPEYKVRVPELVIKMLSPLILREHDRATNRDVYVDCMCENFTAKAKEIVKAQLNMMDMEASLAEGFSIDPVIPKKTVVLSFGCHIDASLGVYVLRGNPALLNFLYHSGIGSRRNQGFGMFEAMM